MRSRRAAGRGMTLVEVLVSAAIMSMIGLALVAIYRSATVEFQLATVDMNFSQRARLAIMKMVPYASSAVPINSQQTTFIYSPQTFGTGDQLNQYPNIYALDFCTSIDFFTPLSGKLGASFDELTMVNPRGTLSTATSSTPAPHYRYRIRFCTQDDTAFPWGKNGQLLLEKMDPADLNPTGALPETVGTMGSSSMAPAVLAQASGGRARVLATNLYDVSFASNQNSNSINVKVTIAGVTRTGDLLDGNVVRNTLGQRQDGDSTAPLERRRRSYTMYSTIMIPYYTGR